LHTLWADVIPLPPRPSVLKNFKEPIMKSLLALLALSMFTGCAVSAERGDEDESVEYEQPFTSEVATLMDFTFDGELTSSSSASSTSQIRAQLMYTVGHFNHEPGVARLDRLRLSNVTRVYSGGLYRIKYRATLPVAWGSKTNLPTSYTLRLPKRIDQIGQNAFLSAYGSTCDDGSGDATINNFWYHYRPSASGCTLAAGDITVSTATAKVSTQNTVAKYPEYHKVWEDGVLNVVSIFGKYEDGATSPSDAGIAAYNEFLSAFRAQFPSAQQSGTSTDATFKVDLGEGHQMQMVALLIDNPRVAGAAFDARYAELTPGADVILYNGHAGLGANIRSLTSKGKFFPGKWQLFFMNGCDTFAYLDEALPQARAKLNADDVSGTKYMDMLTNAMPAYFNDLSDSSMALIRALANPAAPKSYGAIFRDIASVQVVVATGEEDNVFTPARAVVAPVFQTTGAVNDNEAINYQSEVLPAGKYTFAMTPDGAAPAGDADLFLRVGSAPTATSTFKCPSYIYNSNERCSITLTAPSRVFMIAKGDKATLSKYRIDGFKN
jgi:hypothetical protein